MKRTKSKSKSLFYNGTKKSRIRAKYGSKEGALETIRKLKKGSYSKVYKFQVANTMYNRAKYHKYQNDGMREAMVVYKKYINMLKDT
jgi:hypothetical protein